MRPNIPGEKLLLLSLSLEDALSRGAWEEINATLAQREAELTVLETHEAKLGEELFNKLLAVDARILAALEGHREDAAKDLKKNVVVRSAQRAYHRGSTKSNYDLAG